MKKFIALVLALVMVFSVTVNVFAFTALDTTTAMETIRIDGKDGQYFYYDSTTGNVSVGTTTTETGLGDLIMPEKVNADYAFTATTSGTTYHYQVLDEVVASDGKKQYYIYCNDLYGYGIGITPDNNVFDPSVENNIAYWLNNAFYNGGTATTDGVVLDTNIKPYIVDHEWLVEANEAAPTGYPQTDYSVNCKIALLSISEYAKYAKKIGWGAYVNGSLASSGFHMFLRSPVSNSTNLRTLYSSNGCTANIAVYNSDPTKFTANYGAARIRPAFYVSEDYFKNNTNIDLLTAGSAVKAIISELNQGTASADEQLLLKGIYTITEDGSNAISSSDWTNSANVAIDENGYINLTKSKWAARNLPTNVKGGTITIEAEVKEAVGNGLHIGLMYDGDASPSFKYPFYMLGGDGVGRAGYYSEAASGKGTGFKRLENTSYDLWYNHFNQPFNVKVTVNLDTGNCYVSISGKAASDGSDLVRYSDGTTVLPYISGEKTFSKVAFYNSSASDSKIDNIKITYDPNGNAYESIKALDDKTLVVTFKDYVNTANVTAADVLVSNNNAVSAVSNDNKLTVKFEKNLSQNGGYMVVNNLKRADAEGASYCVIGNGTAFDYEIVEYAADVTINNPAFTSGSTVTATASVIPGNTSGKALELILAAYNGNKIVGISNVNRFNVVTGSTTAQTESVTLTLDSYADTFKAFLWDENMIPAAFDSASAQ
ncbi:MAG: hypothetical protein SPF92_06110 [Clostridia bacterium]|nr:hypothetical protein [Clostridia bacterium]